MASARGCSGTTRGAAILGLAQVKRVISHIAWADTKDLAKAQAGERCQDDELACTVHGAVHAQPFYLRSCQVVMPLVVLAQGAYGSGYGRVDPAPLFVGQVTHAPQDCHASVDGGRLQLRPGPAQYTYQLGYVFEGLVLDEGPQEVRCGLERFSGAQVMGVLN